MENTTPSQQAEDIAPQVAQALTQITVTHRKDTITRGTNILTRWVTELPTELANDDFFYAVNNRGFNTRKEAIAEWENCKQTLATKQYLRQFTSGDFQSAWLNTIIAEVK